jgi:hypothetical protein
VLWRHRSCGAIDAGHMLPSMRKGTRFAIGVSLLAALLVAAQPLIVAHNLTLQALQGAPDLGALVICTSHGVVTLSDEAGAAKKAPAQKAPDCPFCALGCNAGASKAFLALTVLQTAPTRYFVNSVAGIFAAHDAPRPLRLVTASPRGPPQRV